MSRDEVDQRWSGKTFDDFLFRPQKGISESRRKVSLKSRLTKKLDLELPIVSANMDSVTGGPMARSMALEGGIGIVHRGQSIGEQAAQVAQIKRSHGAVIRDPLRLPLGATIREARAFTREHSITGILIETAPGSGVLAGLLSKRDIPWMDGHDDDPVDGFMTPLDRLHTGSPALGLEDAEQLMFAKRIERLPLIDAQHRIRGLITARDLRFLKRRPFSSRDEHGRLLLGAAIGARGDFLERAAALIEAGADCLVLDIAHGHSVVMGEAIEAFRARFGDTSLIAGNVGTAEGARFLKDLGCDGIKVGVGPGRGCRTRLETSAGVPQLQAIREAWRAVGESVPILADGGIRSDKDIFLALICGASSVMLGSQLAGTAESPGHIIEDPASGAKSKIYRGMTSPQAVLESLYDIADPDEAESALLTPAEGQEMQIAYRGSVVDIIKRMRGHLQSAVSYAGETSLEAARRKIVPDPLQFLEILTPAAQRESFER